MSGETTWAAESRRKKQAELGIKHTPGPWVLERHPGAGFRRVLTDATQPEPICAVGFTISSLERDANAQLIAAAPDLLEALKTAVRSSYESELSGSGEDHDSWLAIARRAIAKAEVE